MCRKFIEDCLIVIRDRVLPANLAVFQILGFDIILGMDWLSKYYANIDCRKKKLFFAHRVRHNSNFVDLEYKPLHLFFMQFKQDRALEVVHQHF